ncbi:hypothetical protein KM043_003567 [Ampulex compressa]|nr:hypothetical protein KM043_003567 [Ampulex compressa]
MLSRRLSIQYLGHDDPRFNSRPSTSSSHHQHSIPRTKDPKQKRNYTQNNQPIFKIQKSTIFMMQKRNKPQAILSHTYTQSHISTSTPPIPDSTPDPQLPPLGINTRFHKPGSPSGRETTLRTISPVQGAIGRGFRPFGQA